MALGVVVEAGHHRLYQGPNVIKYLRLHINNARSLCQDLMINNAAVSQLTYVMFHIFSSIYTILPLHDKHHGVVCVTYSDLY